MSEPKTHTITNDEAHRIINDALSEMSDEVYALSWGECLLPEQAAKIEAAYLGNIETVHGLLLEEFNAEAKGGTK